MLYRYVDSDPRALALVQRTADGEVLERGATKELNIQKHKVIARAFAKRRLLHEEGRLSISFRSSHGDPVGESSRPCGVLTRALLLRHTVTFKVAGIKLKIFAIDIDQSIIRKLLI